MKKKGNPVAKKLSDPKFKPKVVRAKKGKGSYVRKELEKFSKIDNKPLEDWDNEGGSSFHNDDIRSRFHR